jgi:hypothetical protein
MLTALLTHLGEEEDALIAGLWVQERGHRIADSAAWEFLDVASYVALRERQTEGVLRVHARRARSLSEADVLSRVRSRLEGRGVASGTGT